MFGLFLMTFASVAGASFLVGDEQDDQDMLLDAPEDDSADVEGGEQINILDQLDPVAQITAANANLMDPSDLDTSELDDMDDAEVRTTVDLVFIEELSPGGNETDTEDNVGTAPGESITVDVAPGGEIGHVEYGYGGIEYLSDDDDGEPLDVLLGDGDDEVTITNGVVNVVTGEGSDVVDASGMQGGTILAGSGDLVMGSDVAADPADPYITTSVGIEVHEDAEVRGGEANEFIVSHGDGAIIDGGGGDDTILGFGGSSTLSGGAGDDFIDAHAKTSEYDQMSGYGDVSGDGHADYVDGGTGNDTIHVDGGDTVRGGEGNDMIRVAFDLGTDSDPVTIEDYTHSEDTVTFSIDGFDPVMDENGDESYDPTDRVDVVAEGADSHVYVDDELVAVFENTDTLDVQAKYVSDDGYGAWFGLKLSIGG